MSNEPQDPESYKEMISTFTLFHKVVLVIISLATFGGGCIMLGSNMHRVTAVETAQLQTNEKLDELTKELSTSNALLVKFMQQGERWTYEDVINWYKDSYAKWLQDPNSFPMAEPRRTKKHE